MGAEISDAYPSLRLINRDRPLFPWNDSDVQDFIASDPVHAPSLETAREAAKFSAVGSVIGAVSTAGTGLSFFAGGIFGRTFGHEIANHYYQLYRWDIKAANHKFLNWWERKCQEKY